MHLQHLLFLGKNMRGRVESNDIVPGVLDLGSHLVEVFLGTGFRHADRRADDVGRLVLFPGYEDVVVGFRRREDHGDEERQGVEGFRVQVRDVLCETRLLIVCEGDGVADLDIISEDVGLMRGVAYVVERHGEFVEAQVALN